MLMSCTMGSSYKVAALEWNNATKYRKFLEKRPDILQIGEKLDDRQQRGAQEPTKE